MKRIFFSFCSFLLAIYGAISHMFVRMVDVRKYKPVNDVIMYCFGNIIFYCNTQINNFIRVINLRYNQYNYRLLLTSSLKL
jgi:hypothetical protein